MTRKISIALVIVLVMIILSGVGVAAYYSTVSPILSSSSSSFSTTTSTSITTSEVVTTSASTTTSSTTTSSSSTFDATSSSTTSAMTNETSSSAGCSTLASTNSTEGLALQTYVPTSASVGDSLCIDAVLQNNNQTTISSISGSISITEQNGSVVYSSELVPFQAGSVKLSYGNQLSFQFSWNTTESYTGILPQAGTYTVKVYVQFIGIQSLTYIADTVNVTLSQS